MAKQRLQEKNTEYNAPNTALVGETLTLTADSTDGKATDFKIGGAFYYDDYDNTLSEGIGRRKDIQIVPNIIFVSEAGMERLTKEPIISAIGVDIKDISLECLRENIAMVLQDTHLFTGTIMENIRYGKLDATDEEVYKAAELAHADGFIRMLPKGYETRLSGDGEELSQGQRQLLAIARAAIADPPVLILDEATSSIDTRTERIVQDGMDKLMHGRTTLSLPTDYQRSAIPTALWYWSREESSSEVHMMS